MKKDMLMDAINNVDEDFLAETDMLRQRKSYSRKKLISWVSIAACVCLILGAVIGGASNLNIGNLAGTVTSGSATLDKRFSEAMSNSTTGWQYKNGQWMYYDENGTPTTGWVNNISGYEGKTFYFDNSGVMSVGWLNKGENRYYFDDEGIMQTGLTMIDGKLYYFSQQGVLLQNCVTPGGYTADEDGVIIK